MHGDRSLRFREGNAQNDARQNDSFRCLPRYCAGETADMLFCPYLATALTPVLSKPGLSLPSTEMPRTV